MEQHIWYVWSHCRTEKSYYHRSLKSKCRQTCHGRVFCSKFSTVEFDRIFFPADDELPPNWNDRDVLPDKCLTVIDFVNHLWVTLTFDSKTWRRWFVERVQSNCFGAAEAKIPQVSSYWWFWDSIMHCGSSSQGTQICGWYFSKARILSSPVKTVISERILGFRRTLSENA